MVSSGELCTSAMSLAGQQQWMMVTPSKAFGSFTLPAREARRGGRLVYAREKQTVEKLYRIHVEKNITQDRAEELGVHRWRRWESGKSCHDFRWQVDEQVYITKGCLQVKPLDCPHTAFFYAGDLIRFPKWFVATLTIDKEYEHRYRFLAYGEGEG